VVDCSCRWHLRFVANGLQIASSRKPTWRNWQTRWTQNPVHASECGFDPLRRQSEDFASQAAAKKWQDAVSSEFLIVARSAPMNFVIQQINHHMVGHCDCCDGYRSLEYFDSELGYLGLRCIDHLMVADIELNHGGYGLSRPGVKSGSATLRR
jgi:hypothetical protein